MRIFVLVLLFFFSHCSFANLNRTVKPLQVQTNKSLLSDHITILNYNRMYFTKEYTGWVEKKPLENETTFQYFKRKQTDIGKSRYKWKEISIFDVSDERFQMTDVKSEYVFFVSAGQIHSDREEGSFLQTLQVISFCIIPCKETISLEVSVKLFYLNSLVAEKKTIQSGSRHISPWYLLFPVDFQMKDLGNLAYEPSLPTALFLNGFQEAIDEINTNILNSSHRNDG